jgi:hypothetical protein
MRKSWAMRAKKALLGVLQAYFVENFFVSSTSSRLGLNSWDHQNKPNCYLSARLGGDPEA